MKPLLSSQSVFIPAGGVGLHGDLIVPPSARGIVLFAHGSGSSRYSSRNQFVAAELNRVGLATLLFDLLTEQEEFEERNTRHLRFDIRLLAGRLMTAAKWVIGEPALNELPIGFFGASTGGGAALVAAAELPHQVRAVVSRGGRPDLAGEALDRVRAPTLLIVGGDDEGVIELNSQAYDRLQSPKRMEIVPGATHLFEEPGALETVARLAAEWFSSHLAVTVSHLSETANWTERNL
jgi:fermentation-respiration switch protein FrsA (DUF1100 family)